MPGLLRNLLFGVVVLGAVGFGVAPPAAADTIYTLGQCYGNGGSCPDGPPWGTVMVSSIAGGISVTLRLASNESYATTGAGSKQAVLFDLPGSTLDITNLTSGFTPANATQTGAGAYTLTAGSIHADGSGTWDFGIMCTVCNSGNSGMVSTPVTFDILGSFTTHSFELDMANGKNPAAYFATDIAIANTSFTGDVGSTSFTTVPLPPSLPLLAAALAALAMFFFRGRAALPTRRASFTA